MTPTEATIAMIFLVMIIWLNILSTRMGDAEEQIKSLRRDTRELIEELEKRENNPNCGIIETQKQG